jgi:para-aminobenzoate synthetase/4-amino-4-deoxychorismate lyase
VSTIRADLVPGATPHDIVRALFPCGSITGAPKVRAMEIIRELEETPRGLYCGAIGSFSPAGTAPFNVALRTLTLEGHAGTPGIGGGLVADSSADAEYDECLIKARFFSEGRPPLSLIETFRHEPDGGILRGALHLERLERSARALGLPFEKRKIEEALSTALHGKTQAARVRILLNEDGTLEVTTQDFIPQASDTVWRYVISEHRVRSTDLLAHHKTTWRTHFDEERRRWTALGCDEVVYLNERGEVAEASGANIFARIGAQLLTPPLSSGALPGCLRRDLLERGECREAVLTVSDLQTAETVYIGNSLRGLIQALPFNDR